MEPIITLVGFLGAGKTTILKQLTKKLLDHKWQPFVILNDYENAHLDSQQLTDEVAPKWIKVLNGSCICCSGINELRDTVNRIPNRKNGITLIEANGTSDACTLLEFLSVGLETHFLPPIQISVVDVKNWQTRDDHNILEANQIQVSSLIILTHLDLVSKKRKEWVLKDLQKINAFAQITTLEKLDFTILPKLLPIKNQVEKLEHLKAHWSSCSVDLPTLPHINCIQNICNALPKQILRVKGCTQIADQENYTYFEQKPDGEISIRPFNGIPITGTKLITIGPGSNPETLKKAIQTGLETKF